jgi:hypothetical protein
VQQLHGLREGVPEWRDAIRGRTVKRRTSDVLAFGGAAGAVGVSAVIAKVLCPGTCAGCASCMASVAPMAGAALAVGSVIAGPALARAWKRAKVAPAVPRD